MVCGRGKEERGKKHARRESLNCDKKETKKRGWIWKERLGLT